MQHGIARFQCAVELVVASFMAAATAIAVGMLGSGGAVLLLSPEDAEEAGISFAV